MHKQRNDLIQDKLFYYDLFRDSNTNYFWQDKFRLYTHQLIPLSLGRFPTAQVISELKKEYAKNSDAKCMIHFGGSAKLNQYAPLEDLKRIKKECPKVRLTAHYGDVYYNEYNQERAKFFDAIHTTNAANLDPSLKSMYFFPHCIDFGWFDFRFFHNNPEEILNCESANHPSFYPYDLMFAGSPYSGVRVKFLKDIATKFPSLRLGILGSSWESYRQSFPKNIILLGPSRMNETIRYYQRSRIVLDDPVTDYCQHTSIGLNCAVKKREGCRIAEVGTSFLPEKYYQRAICANKNCPHFRPTYKWFSSRPLHALLSMSPAILTPRTGQEEVLPFAFYAKTLDEYCDKIDYILTHPKEAMILARKGHEHVKQFTFENAIEKLITHSGEKDE